MIEDLATMFTFSQYVYCGIIIFLNSGTFDEFFYSLNFANDFKNWSSRANRIPYSRKIYPQFIFFFRFLYWRQFFEVWRHYFDVARFIFERGLCTGEVKS